MKQPENNDLLPPKWAAKMLEWACPIESLEEVQGDLQELFRWRVQQLGESKAKRQYILDIMSLARSFTLSKTKKYPPSSSIPMFKNYSIIALRNMRRNKVFSFINISGLSIGLACCMLIFLYTKDEVSFDRFHEKRDHIFRVTATITNPKETRKIGSTNMVVGPSFAKEIPEIETFLRLQENLLVVRHGTETFNQEAVFVDDNFFSVFSLPLIEGDPARVLSELNSIVLTEETANRYFGTTHALGKTLEINGSGKFEPFVVTGIAKNPPQNSSIKFSMLLPFKYNEKTAPSYEWIGFYMNTFLVLRPDADYKTVEAKLDKVFLKYANDELVQAKEKFNFNNKIHFGLQPLLQIHLDTEYGDSRNGIKDSSKPIYSYILTGIAIFILLIACINFINLTIAHSLKRGKEIGIRKVVGSQRIQLIKQFLGESFVLCLVAFVMAILLVEFTLPIFNELANKRLSFSYLLDIKLVTAYIALFLVTGFIAGFYPAIVLSGFHPVQTLYNRHKLTGKNYLTRSLVVFQFALATILTIATVVIYSQFNYLTHKDLGYNDENLLTVNLGWGVDGKLVELFKNELSKEPGIQMVATKDFGQNYTNAKIEDREVEFAISFIDENYFPALQIPLVQGRNFSPEFSADQEQSIMINETFAREVGWQEAIGKQVDFFYENKKYRVIGVVKDYHFSSLKEKISPHLYRVGAGNLWIKLKPGIIAQTLKTIETTHNKLLPLRPFEYKFMNTINTEQYESEAKWKQIITLGAILTIFVSCIGLFGLTTLSMQQRTKEIGIRKVFGASVNKIVLLVTRDFIKLVCIAFVIAAPIAWYAANKWLENFAYQIDISWWIFVLAGSIALTIALLTVSFQAIKAALADPVKSLRNE
jgi:putative ABC transport system permease protein